MHLPPPLRVASARDSWGFQSATRRQGAAFCPEKKGAAGHWGVGILLVGALGVGVGKLKLFKVFFFFFFLNGIKRNEISY